MKLRDMHCSPISRGSSPLSASRIRELTGQLGNKWIAEADQRIRREFSFDSYMDGISFVNRVADLAEAENHHPDLRVSFGSVTVELSTHDVGGLSENDFILAAKIEML